MTRCSGWPITRRCDCSAVTMATTCEPCVMFPCDLPNWPAIKEKLLGLNGLTSPTRLVEQLQAIQQLIPVDEGPWGAGNGVREGNWARFLSLTQSKLRLCSANHRAGYFSNLACDWLSTVWAYSELKTENGPRFVLIFVGKYENIFVSFSILEQGWF